MDDCFVHASDLHLDAPLGDLGQLDADHRSRLTNLATKAWDNLVKLCISEQASFLVLAGDIFDNIVASPVVQLQFHEGLRQLAGKGVRAFICHGNHDPLSKAFNPVGELPEGAIRFVPGTPQSHVVTLRNSGDLVLVSGVSFGTQHETGNLARRFAGLSPPPAAVSAPHVAVLHANVGGNPGHDPYAPCSYDDLDGAGVDYWALGHIHKREVRQLDSGGWAAYCGNLQGRSFKAAECEHKGALVVPIEQGHLGEPRFKPCDEVRLVRGEIAVTPGDSIPDVRERLSEAAAKLGVAHAPKPVMWNVRLTGTNDEAGQMRYAVDNDELRSHVSDKLSKLLGGGGLCRLEAAVRTALNREAILLAGDLRADVLSELQRLRKSALNRSAAGTPTVEIGADVSRDARASDSDDHYDDKVRTGADDDGHGRGVTQDDVDSSGHSSAAPDIHELLQDGLPPALSDAWRDILDQRPERLGDVLALAEELLLKIFAEAQESVSVQAMFGGVNPFKESDQLSADAKNLLGAPKGRASSRSARELHLQAESLSGRLRTLSSARSEWARIEASINTANSQRDKTESELAALAEDSAAVSLALVAFTRGLVELRDTTAEALSNAPKPTARDEYLHEQASLARERIGDLRSAQNEVDSARRNLEAATDAVHGNWRPLIGAEALGEAGLAAADEAERRLKDFCDQEKQAETERNIADKRALTSETDFGCRADELREKAPDGVAPDHWPTIGDGEPAGSDDRDGPTNSMVLGDSPANRYRIGTRVVAAICVVILGAVSVTQGDLVIAAVALLGGLALSLDLVVALRQQRPWDPALIELARAYKSARNNRDAARKALGDAQRDLDRQTAHVHRSRQHYWQRMKALGVPHELIERFGPDAVQHLKAVHKAQSENAGLARAQEARTRRLEEVRKLFTGDLATNESASESARTAEAPDEATPSSAAVIGHRVPLGHGTPIERHDVESQARSATAKVELRDAAEAQVRLKTICDRVDQYRTAEREAGEADISLRKAVQHNETALSYIERSNLEDLRKEESELSNERRRLEAELKNTKEKITNLGVEKRQLESSENQAAMLSLERSELSARIEDAVVQGLGRHLAASLLRDAAEQHRMEQQPELLRRIRGMGCEVADWTGVTVNPHAADASSSADQADNLLVAGPRGEHPAHRLSLGARTLLYLSLRLATLEKQANVRGVRLPVILDDVLIGLDDQRSDRVLALLSEFSERCQLILLTCHERTKQRAQAAGAFFLPIPPP